ncbi:Glutamate--tRNA ligase [Piscirickettsia salmonis]|uniref:Glutamate--tRNA ligase n=1 Tax=Piscirickettsia salmonis TaxID=1238 RepID=A0AAC8VHZ4_PISSA|nr:glutamate--tRNA ligase [Piscirickettsia salmonis]ALB22909.1 glutamate--tRNA ligase [Piscirickettsia salmonis]QGN98488.1 Glutamate--tRNA ligase [Piscirickettsia salmonis]QGO02108.1 Glutamate--tRNA ligase [Piscirickettsia salmonis]QGO12796.1 Glutamate--tRNA ligase [Piscirickettsia salmonis]QGO19838.1 Glutamate--tRNA ligase [Piscirickettsia salmonis]
MNYLVILRYNGCLAIAIVDFDFSKKNLKNNLRIQGDSGIDMKTRFAPSPTGLMHLGNVRTALFSALLAHSDREGCFVLRIEDTDEERSELHYVDAVQEDLQWLGIQWEEGPGVNGDYGPYFQSERHEIYDRYYQQLIDKKLAYPCFCSEKKLEMVRKAQRAAGQPPRYPSTCRSLTAEEVAEKLAEGQQASLRFSLPRGETIDFIDVVKGLQRFNSDDIGDFIIRRSNGAPSFMFCNAIDDSLMKVTHVLRGEDHLTNSPRQLMILKALGLPELSYGHISMITSKEGNKLSKREGSFSIRDLREAGYLPAAVVNYMARLGHYFGDLGFVDIHELAEHFNIESLSKSAARYDEEQLKYWQKEAVLHSDADVLWQWMGDQVHSQVPEAVKSLFIDTVRPNIVFPNDVLTLAKMIFDGVMLNTLEVNILEVFKGAGLEFFNIAVSCAENSDGTWKSLTAAIKEQTGVKGKQLFQPLRIALTGQLHGPELGPVVNLLGKEQLIHRLINAVNFIEGA